MLAGIAILSFLTSEQPFLSKYCLRAVPAHAVTISLIVTFNYLDAFLTSANLISDDVAEIFLPLSFLTPSFRGFLSYLTVSSFQATLGRKSTTLSFISMISRNVNLRGKGIKRLMSKLSP
jgi:hypothetical protein